MTPQEKALELVEKYKGLVYPYSGSGMLTNTEEPSVILLNAKQCALISVDEVIKESKSHITTFRFKGCNSSDKEYWKEVKQEIEKL